MLSKSVRFSLTVAAIYLAWVLISGMALAFTPMGSTWIYALNGLLLGLMPLAYQLTCGTRPRSPQPIALAGGLTALIATILCINYLDEIYAGSTRLIALTAGYLIGLCWYGDSRRAVALTAVGALVAAAVGAWLLYGLQSALTTGMAAHSLNMRLPLYFATAVALLLGLALPLPRLARRVTVPLAIVAVQLVVIVAALLGYSGVARNGFVSFCANLALGLRTNYAYCLYVGIAGMLLRQLLTIALTGSPSASKAAPARPVSGRPANQAP